MLRATEYFAKSPKVIFAFTMNVKQFPTRALKKRKPPPTPKVEPKVIWDSKPDFRINPDPYTCRICLKMLWMHYLLGVSHFAKYGRLQIDR